MLRPNRSEVLFQVALAYAQRGTCDRKKVGAVIAREGRIISVGYNGAPPGLPHCEENEHGWNDEEKAKMLGCVNATHAEANALAFAARYGVSTDDAELFVTVSPCDVCARLLIAAGIGRVHYLEEYRNLDGIKLLADAGIIALEWSPVEG